MVSQFEATSSSYNEKSQFPTLLHFTIDIVEQILCMKILNESLKIWQKQIPNWDIGMTMINSFNRWTLYIISFDPSVVSKLKATDRSDPPRQKSKGQV